MGSQIIRVLRQCCRLITFCMPLFLVAMETRSASAIGGQSDYVGPDNGNWSLDTNWNPTGVPTGGSDVNFIDSVANDRTLVYDYTGAPLTLGVFTIDQTGSGPNINTLSMADNALSVKTEYLGKMGRAVFKQTGGVHTIGTLAVGTSLQYGTSASAEGTYNMSNNAALVAQKVTVGGYGGTGMFNQTGGLSTLQSLTLGAAMIGVGNIGPVGSGSFNLSTAILKVSDSEYVGSEEPGIFNQISGDHTVGKFLFFGADSSGTFTLSDGTLTVSDPSVAGGGEFIGYYASVGVFNQTGGRNSRGQG